MPVRIVDASAFGALVFGEPQVEEIAKALEGSPMGGPGADLVRISQHLFRKIKANPVQREKILTAFTLTGRLPVEIVEVDHHSIITYQMKLA